MMLTSKDKFIKQVNDGFQNLKGKASVYCFTTSVIPELVYNIIVPFSKKHPNPVSYTHLDVYKRQLLMFNIWLLSLKIVRIFLLLK